MKIGVFDSGIGGVTILAQLLLSFPYEDFIYYGDSLNNPYGEESPAKIYELARKNVIFLKNKGCKVIVIACNTVSSICIDHLREEFRDLFFISTLPALKVAMDNDTTQNVLVMATSGTINSTKFQNLYHNYDHIKGNIFLLPCPGLAKMIEDDKDTKAYLLELLTPYQNKNINTIVLGCTHYPLIKEEIKQIIPGTLIDGSKGIAKQLGRILTNNNLLSQNVKNGKTEIYNSNPDYIFKTKMLLESYQQSLLINDGKK